MADDDGTALDLALELRSGSAVGDGLPDEVRVLVTAPAAREVIASILLGELAQRIRRETNPADYQQNGCA